MTLACKYRFRKRCFRHYECVRFGLAGDVDYCLVYLDVKFPARKVKSSPVPQGALIFGNKFCQRKIKEILR